MSVVAIVDAVADLISANKDTLLYDLVRFGQARRLDVTTTVLTPAAEYHFCYVSCPDSRVLKPEPRSRTTGPNTGLVTWEFEIMLEFWDRAQIKYGETSNYAQSHQDFRKMVDRVSLLITQTASFGSVARLPDDWVIERNDLTGPWSEGEDDPVPWLYAQVRFPLVSECVDDALLY